MISDAGKTISILGCTGSIGCSTIKVIETCPTAYNIQAVTANSNAKSLAEIAKKLNAKIAVVADEAKYAELKSCLSGTKIAVAAGKQAVIDAAAMDCEIVMSAIVGSAGLLPTLKAVERGAKIALANKESLVCAGDIIMRKAIETGAQIIPVDSEHSAIFQVFDFEKPQNIEKITLTASGGPFRTKTLEYIANVTPKEAVKHPNWSMGNKISIDSATMMNKGLEIIEAYHLFPVGADNIDVVVHPESIIHSMAEYVDGSVLAQLGTPDMCTPIAVALSWPDRISIPVERLDLVQISKFTFESVDDTKFPAINLAKLALSKGGAYPAILNSANEIAVSAFLSGKIGFLDIVSIVERTMSSLSGLDFATIENILEAIKAAEKKAEELVRMWH